MKRLMLIILLVPIKVYAYNYIDINTVFDADIDVSNISCLSVSYENPEAIEASSSVIVEKDKYFKLNTKFRENAKIFSAGVCDDLLNNYKVDINEKVEGNILYLTLMVHDNRHKGQATTSNREELINLLFPDEEKQNLTDDIIDIGNINENTTNSNNIISSTTKNKEEIEKEKQEKEEKKKIEKENKKRKLVFTITYAIIGLFVLIIVFKAGINLIKANK